jgi:hypothetical protein
LNLNQRQHHSVRHWLSHCLTDSPTNHQTKVHQNPQQVIRQALKWRG